MAKRKLEIGGGPKPREGYEQLDVTARPHVDYVGTADAIPVPDASFHEVYGRHVFEHFTPLEADRVLKEIRRVLVSGGILHLIMPDLEFHAKQLLWPGQSEFLPHMTNYDHALYSIYGHQTIHKDDPAMVHKWGYTRRTLEALLKRHLFRPEFKDCRACDLEVVAVKG